MHAVIVGCGRVGAEMARALEDRGFTVAIIDQDPKQFERRLYPGFHGKKIVGLGFDRDVLEEAGIKDAEIFCSVTRGDNSNVVSARIAREHYGVPHVAALIYDPRRALIYERLGISTVATVSWSTDQMLARVLPAAESVEWTVGNGEVVVIGIMAPRSLVGKPVNEIESPGKIGVVAVTRFGETKLVEARMLVQEGDLLHLSVLRTAVPEVSAWLHGQEEGE